MGPVAIAVKNLLHDSKVLLQHSESYTYTRTTVLGHLTVFQERQEYLQSTADQHCRPGLPCNNSVLSSRHRTGISVGWPKKILLRTLKDLSCIAEGKEAAGETFRMGAFSRHACSHTLHCLHIAPMAHSNPCMTYTCLYVFTWLLLN
jgi:hypothetical protein